MKKIEMIIEYTTDGTDYQYNDNHGVLTRCKDCKWFNEICKHPNNIIRYTTEKDYCSKAEKR